MQSDDLATGDKFGFQVAISGDGTRLVAGAANENTFVGSAYVFALTGGVWAQEQKITAPGAGAGDLFFSEDAVSLDGDGSTLVIGANRYDTSAADQGEAYVFTRSGTVWSHAKTLVASDAAAGDRFGWSVAISGDGATIAAGALDEEVSAGVNNGAVYVFTGGGATWAEQQKLIPTTRVQNAQFGNHVSLSNDGDTLMIAALFDDGFPAEAPASDNAGAAYIFTRSGGTWSETIKLTESGSIGSAFMGHNVSMSGDGLAAVTGTRTDPSVSDSKVFVYRLNGTWAKEATLQPAAHVTVFLSDIGAINYDGSRVVVGALNAISGTTTGAGAAFVFDRIATVWTEGARHGEQPPTLNRGMGWRVAIPRNQNAAIVMVAGVSGTPEGGAAFVCNLPADPLP